MFEGKKIGDAASVDLMEKDAFRMVWAFHFFDMPTRSDKRKSYYSSVAYQTAYVHYEEGWWK